MNNFCGLVKDLELIIKSSPIDPNHAVDYSYGTPIRSRYLFSVDAPNDNIFFKRSFSEWCNEITLTLFDDTQTNWLISTTNKGTKLYHPYNNPERNRRVLAMLHKLEQFVQYCKQNNIVAEKFIDEYYTFGFVISKELATNKLKTSEQWLKGNDIYRETVKDFLEHYDVEKSYIKMGNYRIFSDRVEYKP